MTVQDILDKKFGRSFFGYDPQQVDGFLDDIIDRLEEMERERQEMLTTMEYLLKEIEGYESSGEAEQRRESGKNARKNGSGLNAFRDPSKRADEAEAFSSKPAPEPITPPERKEVPGKPSFLILPEKTEQEADEREAEREGESLIDQLLREYPPDAEDRGDGK